MRRISFFYFIPNDLKFLVNKHKKELVLLLSLFLAGLVVGIIIAMNAESEYTGSFVLIISNEFNPFKSLWVYSAILLFSIICCFLSAWKKWFGILLLGIVFFLGYIFGRISCFSIIGNTFWGILSILIFVLPNALIMLFCIYLIFCKMQEEIVCGLSLKQNTKHIIMCLKGLGIGFAFLFVINIVIGGIINLLVNIV